MSKTNDRLLLIKFWSFARPYRTSLRNVYFLYFLNSVLNLIPAASLRYYFDVIIEGNVVNLFGWQIRIGERLATVSDQLLASIVYFAAVAVVIVVANWIGVVMWRASTRVSQKVILDIKHRVQRHLHKLSISYFERERTGNIMTRTVGDVDQLEQMLRNSFDLLYSLIHLLMVPLIMLGMSPLLFLMILPPIPVIVWAVLRIRKKLRPIYHKMRIQQADINASMQEHISGIREIRAFGRESLARLEYSRANIEYVRSVNESMKIFSINHQVLYGTRDVAMMILATGGGVMILYGTGNVTLGMLMAFIPLMGRFFDPIQHFVRFYDVIQRGLASTERIFAFLDDEPEVRDHPQAQRIRLSRGDIRFEQVSFAYGDGPPILKDLSFAIAAGQKVALVGPTGAGKSTLVSLLLRFHSPTAGRILMDGHDLELLRYSSLVEATGMVFQDPFLFYGTLEENIGFSAPQATAQQIRAAAQQAQIADFIESLPDGYATRVGERGVKLSGGQRQRITIARMLLKNPRIIILDEATSAVDTETEEAIQASLDMLLAGRTSLIIAHRLSTIRNADLVLTLDDGRLVEAGSPEELLAMGGKFAQLSRSGTLR
jgi:ABC-type multidrug transport system fused ATPase/permease subunit